MKKLLVLILCLSSTMLFAQELHYVIDNTGCEAMQTTVTGVLMVDNVELYNGAGMQDAGGQYLEIGVFDQDGICRGTKLPTWRAKSNQWIYQLKLRGNTGMTYPTFKVYDHATETEWDVVLDIEETIVWTANGKYGSTTAPYAINFTAGATQTFTRTIEGYGDSNGGYVLLASPVDGADPATSEMIADPASDYDLYYFEQSAALQWINYKNQSYELTVGKGYLYAHKNGTTVTITGTPYTGDGMIPLDYDAASPFAGYNLIGNPFGTQATLTSHPYYKLDETGTYFDATPEQTEAIGCMFGVLVQAEAEGEFADFDPIITKSETKATPMANVVVSSNGKRLDKAVIRFDNGKTLGKLQLNENSTKVYLPQEGKDLAIANASSDEMPLNFKAETTGQYTISFQLNDANLGYLHLFDKLTGEDVNLLMNSEYSFVGSPRDAEDRFIVRFSELAANDIFVYQNGDELIVNGDGQLQVFDVMGRYVATFNVNGNSRISASQFANAVYIFRMVGTDVKTQKIVVR